jgi:hypothetical protein
VVVELELGDVVDVVVDVDVLVDVVDVVVDVVVGQFGDVVDVVVDAELCVAADASVTEQQGGSGLAMIRSAATAPPDGYDHSTSTANEEGLPMHVGGKLIVYVFSATLKVAVSPSEWSHVTA